MKILTIVVPVYNTELYLRRCLDSVLLLPILDDIEVIAVNDESKDNSLAILKEYEAKFPTTVKVIDKENGGHGSTINAALKVANGKYFRVLDSDDWFNCTDFIEFVKRLKTENCDVVITDYKKEFIFNSTSENIAWNLEENLEYDFNTMDISILNKEYFVMANSTYKTELLHSAGLELFEKTFYVDMQYNVVPASKINTFKYYKLNIYRYFIGRPEQSMNLQNFVKNRNHHLKVVRFLIEHYLSLSELSENKKTYIEQILFYTLTTHYYIYCVYAQKDKLKVRKEIKEFDKYLKITFPKLYVRLNEIGQIRYNRITRFFFTAISPGFFSKLITKIGNLFQEC